MEIIIFIGIVCIIHCAIFFLDTLFKSCSHYPYLSFLNGTGLEVKLFRIKWFTTILNRPLQKWGLWRPRFMQAWLSVGTIVSLMLIPISLFIVIRMGITTWAGSFGLWREDSPAPVVLEPLIPGINLPFNEFGYYLVTLIACSFIHEIGHGIAAVREDVHVSGFGFFLVLIIPVACVYLDEDQFAALAPYRRLRILCAGIWHNVYLAGLAAVGVIFLPWILHPFYITGRGIQVLDISPHSSVLGPSGLLIGDELTSINHCTVSNTDDWRGCLLAALKNQSPGYCTSAEFVRENDESIRERAIAGAVECCSAESESNGRLCFQLVDESGGPVELPEHSCLPGRAITDEGKGFCAHGPNSECESGLHCLRPILANSTKLIQIQRREGKVVLFIGNPAEIYQTVEVSDYISRWSSPSVIPNIITLAFKYFTTISGGLAVVNIFPCFCFDGQHIVAALSDLLLANYLPDKSMRSAISLCVTVLGSVLLATVLLPSFYAIF